MPSEKVISIVVGAIIIIAILYIVVWPHIRRAMLLKSGRTARAVVKSIARTAIKNENKQYLHKVELEVHADGAAPYSVTVTELLPWLHGEGTGLIGTDFEVRVHKSHPSWVTIVGPMRTLPA